MDFVYQGERVKTRFVYDHRGFLIRERHPEIGILETTAAAGMLIVDSDN